MKKFTVIYITIGVMVTILTILFTYSAKESAGSSERDPAGYVKPDAGDGMSFFDRCCLGQTQSNARCCVVPHGPYKHNVPHKHNIIFDDPGSDTDSDTAPVPGRADAWDGIDEKLAQICLLEDRRTVEGRVCDYHEDLHALLMARWLHRDGWKKEKPSRVLRPIFLRESA